MTGLLHSHLNGIVTCHGDSCCFPVSGKGWDPAQLGGPSLLTNSSSSVSGCLGNGVVQMGEICGRHEDDATGGTIGGKLDVGATGGATGGKGISS